MIIGVIGVGVVGGACLKAFSTVTETVGYDIRGVYHDEVNWDKILHKADVAFVCVPSPTADDKQDLTALEQVISRLRDDGYKGVVCIKCTVLPGTTDKLRAETGLRITHNPEFLTAAKPYEDFMAQKTIIIGGPAEDCKVVAQAYGILFKHVPSLFYPSVVTEIAKYMRNTYLAMKVSFANEYYRLCKHVGCDYDLVKNAMLTQGGVEPGHWSVPGPDGKFGYSGMCFPKDVRAMRTFLHENGLSANVLDGVEATNQEVRPHDKFCKEINA